VHLVLQDDDRRFPIPVDAEIVSAVHRHEVAVTAVQVDDVLSPFYAPGVAVHRDDVLEDHIVGQEVEVVLSVGETLESFPDDTEEGAG
jgi:hypothetical protein